MTTAASAHELAEAGLFSDAARAIDQSTDVSRDLRVLRARLESHVGAPQHAKKVAQQLLRERLSQREMTTCWDVVGRVTLYGGQITDGLRALNQALLAAQASGDPKLQARARASYIEGLLHWVGIEPATVEIQKLRQEAIRAADPYSLVELHWLNAEIKAKRGLVSAAAASIAAGRSLLSRFGNLGQQGRLAIIASGVAIIQSDYDAALKNALEALDCATKSGSRELRIPALNNLAYIRLTQQGFDDARMYLDELLGIQKSEFTDLGVRDTAMMLALASGDLERATSLANVISKLSLNQEDGDSYYKLWHLPTRIRWLFRVGDVDAGLSAAIDAMARIAPAADRNLTERLRLLAAEGLGRAGRASQGTAFLSLAVNSNPDPSLEMVAESYRVAGRLAATTDPTAALAQFQRAARILESIGNLSGRAEVERDALETLHRGLSSTHTTIESLVEGSSSHRDTSSQDITASVTERIAALIEFGSHAPLLARETLALICDSKAVRHAAIFATADGAVEPLGGCSPAPPLFGEEEQGVVRINIGRHQNKDYVVTALPFPTAAARTTLLSIENLVRIALTVSKAKQLEREQAALWPEQTPEQQLGLICSSEKMLDLVKTIRRVAATNVTVLLTGETGVGKELFARALHQASSRSDKVFLPFNCATVPREMFDSQLFGHRRGSFTGAIDDAAGVIRSAAGGTLFLDEIGEMSPDTQPKLLRFLESGEIRPLGDAKPQLVDVRIVAATNANLDQLIADGRFREDLYYRLNVIRINIPPLRDRREEIPALVEHFLERYGREFEKPQLRVADETLEYLVLYRWPGNVRQLANEIRRIVALAEPGAVLMPAHLSDDIAASRMTIPTARPALQSTEVLTRLDQPLAAAVDHIERAAIQRAVSVAEGNLLEAAKMLGLSRKGLYLKRQRLGLA